MSGKQTERSGDRQFSADIPVFKTLVTRVCKNKKVGDYMVSHRGYEQKEKMKKDGESFETVIKRLDNTKKLLEEVNKNCEKMEDWIIEQMKSKDEYKELFSKLEEEVEKSIKTSLGENHNIHKDNFETGDSNHRTLEGDNRQNGDAAYKYHSDKEMYKKLKDEIIKQTVLDHILDKKTGVNRNMEALPDIPAVGRSR